MRRSYAHLAIVLAILMVSMTFAGCIGSPRTNKGTIHSSPSPPTPEADNGNSSYALELSQDITNIVRQVKPAVIFISATVQTKSFFGSATETKSGSGVIIDPAGYALTNNHVVENASKIEATLTGSRKGFKAKVVGKDPLTDLAVIKLKGGDSFPTASFGDASKVQPGNLVIAIGNALALKGGPTTTLGVVSNTHRSFNIGNSMYYDVIQTDAAINPGNSGGPLVNLKGKVIGINTFIARKAQNMGFAISANTAQPVYEDLVSPPHRVIRPWLGVSLADVTPHLAAKEGLFKKSGAFVAYVKQGSPADKAGFKKGDVITRFEGEEITSVTQFLKLLWQGYEPGEEVTITFWRGKKKHTVRVELGKRPENP